MSNRFICRFAVGRNSLAYSGVWRVWTARKQPDLYLAVEAISGTLKATVHCPRLPHFSFERHYSFTQEATGPVAAAALKDSGRHQIRWSGCVIGLSCTLEYRVIFPGKSLDKEGATVSANTALLPVPTEQEIVEVAVLLGPPGPTSGYPCEKDVPTRLLSEGRLSDGRRVWVVYCTKLIEVGNNAPPTQPQRLTAVRHYVDPTVDFSKVSMRGALHGEQPDGSLAFWDVSAKYTPNAFLD